MEECPICGQKAISQKFLSCEDYLVSHKLFSVICCDACRFIFTQNSPLPDEITAYYDSSEYVSHSNTKTGLINTVYHLVRKVMIGKKTKLIQKISKGRTLLDVGCGTGYFAGTMKQKDWKVIGIEPSKNAAEMARQKFGLVVKPPEALFEFPEQSFDVITLWHVLEHLPNLNEAMTQFHKLLKDNGVLVVALPNVDSYDAKKYQQFWAAYDVPRHLWHFSPNTFLRFAEKCKFNIIDIKPMPFDAFYISMLSEKNKKNKFAAIRGFYHGIISYLICLFNKKKSSSLIYILKKRR